MLVISVLKLNMDKGIIIRVTTLGLIISLSVFQKNMSKIGDITQIHQRLQQTKPHAHALVQCPQTIDLIDT